VTLRVCGVFVWYAAEPQAAALGRVPGMPGLRIRGGDLIAICVAMTTEIAIKPGDDTPGTANLKTDKAHTW
jgi:hypothetical protein